ncbi:MAG: argininosuccinate synthase [Candidatus Schekmanbacteria bacterium]|nr:argininosuccinate synthase [Candidatus Schekmanbacteria bacterium]
MNINKMVLAYSGGLDTSVIIKWAMEWLKCEVIAVTCDLGQNEDAEAICRKALKTGASKAYVRKIADEFLKDFCLPALQAHAIYENKYLLATALGRPLIAKHLVEIAQAEGADAIAHGSTGKGNDQVRFDVSVMALDSRLKIVAPVRSWHFKSRNEEIEFAMKHNIPVEATKEKPYSIDRNIWGISIECGILEDPWQEPPDDIYQITSSIAKAPDQPEYVEIDFEDGVPVALNGDRLSLLQLVERLNAIGGRHGVGRVDLVENRLVGIKSREIYEAPAATILHLAHSELERLVLDRETQHFKQILSQRYSELIYNGWWFSPLRKALDAFFGQIQKVVTGKTRIKLHKGQAVIVGRQSACSLYDYKLATYDKEDVFDHLAGEAFCKLWGLPLQVVGAKQKGSM